MTTTADIIAALSKMQSPALKEIEAALHARITELKDKVIKEAGELGLACHDNNGKKAGRPPKPKHDSQ